MDLSKLSTEDLQALAAGDMSKVSEDGLRMLAGPRTAMTEGAAARPQLRDALATLQGPTFGFGDELIGGVVGGAKTLFNDKPFKQNYEETRDFVRGAVAQQMKDAPVRTMASQVIASLPVGMPFAGPIQSGLQRVLPQAVQNAPLVGKMVAPMITGTAVGGTSGAINAFGNSEAQDAIGRAEDVKKDLPLALAMGASGVPIIRAMGAASQGLAALRSGTASGLRYAQEKLAEALQRDQRTIAQTEARMGRLGQEATIADSAGPNTRQLLDTVVTLPGNSKTTAENLIRQRQATRGDRLIGAAESASGTGGVRMASQVDDWIQQRAQQAGPLYDQVRQINLNPDQELLDLVRAAETLGATSAARRMAVARQQPYTLNVDNPGQFALNDLDQVKRGLDQIIATTGTGPTGRTTPMGAAVDDLRRKLVAKLDDLTGGPTGVYAQARNAFAGPSQLMDAAEMGRRAMSQDDASIRAMQSAMSASERDAFALGAFEALRAKLGTRAGQTQMMELWREKGMQEKLKAIFGSERAYREFAADLARERTLKSLESVGRGSQTAARLQAADDLDVSPVMQAAAAVSNPSPTTVLGAMQSFGRRVATPEPVRNALGEILLSRGPAATNRLRDLQDAMREVEAARAREAALYGLGLGQVSNVLPGLMAP